MAHDTHDLVTEILSEIAIEKHKSIDRIAHLLLVVQNKAIVRQFWLLLDHKAPFHHFEYVGCCPDCGSFELL